MMPAIATHQSCVDRLRMDEAVDRLVAGDDRAEQDDQHDEDAGQVLDPAIAIGKAPRRLAPRQHERDPKRDRGRRVANVVDGVGQQRHAARGDTTTSICKAAVIARMTNDHLMAQMPRVGRRDGRIDDAVGMAMPTSVTVAMGGVPRCEAEPIEKRAAEDAGGCRGVHRNLLIALSSASCSRLPAPTAPTRQWSIWSRMNVSLALMRAFVAAASCCATSRHGRPPSIIAAILRTWPSTRRRRLTMSGCDWCFWTIFIPT